MSGWVSLPRLIYQLQEEPFAQRSLRNPVLQSTSGGYATESVAVQEMDFSWTHSIDRSFRLMWSKVHHIVRGRRKNKKISPWLAPVWGVFTSRGLILGFCCFSLSLSWSEVYVFSLPAVITTVTVVVPTPLKLGNLKTQPSNSVLMCVSNLTKQLSYL